MSLRGAYQLRQLVVSWCDKGGASTGVREAVAGGLIKQFQSQYPYVHIPDPMETISRGSFPCIQAQWENGNEISYSVRNKTAEEVVQVMEELRRRKGARVRTVRSRIFTKKPSIQGRWSNAIPEWMELEQEETEEFSDIDDDDDEAK